MNIQTLLSQAIAEKVSDIFIISHLPVTFKIDGNFAKQGEELMTPEHTQDLIAQIYALAGNRSQDTLRTSGDDDFSFLSPVSAGSGPIHSGSAAPLPQSSGSSCSICPMPRNSAFRSLS